MKRIKLVLTLTVFFSLVSVLGFAQPGGDPGGGGNPTVPITGIEFLLGGGLLIGLRGLIAKFKSRKE
ncbi:MAG: hypothetical protein HOP08_16845 [Cyclobacteriaceae bacterium]|nr:hypothetical protein [Cyclobacteriaceae bacterium]